MPKGFIERPDSSENVTYTLLSMQIVFHLECSGLLIFFREVQKKGY